MPHTFQGMHKLPSTPADVCSVLQSKSKARAFSFTVQTPGFHTVSSIVLMAKTSTKKSVVMQTCNVNIQIIIVSLG